MHSNYISERFNYVAAQERNGQKMDRNAGSRIHGEERLVKGRRDGQREEFLDKTASPASITRPDGFISSAQ